MIYGRPDGTLAHEPQPRVLSIVDAVIAGQGDGPLAPRALPLGLVFGGANSAAVDHVGAHLLGCDPTLIPIVREALQLGERTLTLFPASAVALLGDLGNGLADEILPAHGIAKA